MLLFVWSWAWLKFNQKQRPGKQQVQDYAGSWLLGLTQPWCGVSNENGIYSVGMKIWPQYIYIFGSIRSSRNHLVRAGQVCQNHSIYIHLSLSGAFSGLSKVSINSGWIRSVSRLFSLPLSLSILSLLPNTDGCSNKHIVLFFRYHYLSCHLCDVAFKSSYDTASWRLSCVLFVLCWLSSYLFKCRIKVSFHIKLTFKAKCVACYMLWLLTIKLVVHFNYW